ncbi:hypothetical protein GCM10018962_66080 [Dactylosporangium matsuzakiense]|uniref:Sulfatase n=1 Tax=Dactylosporangium matsuzakiense TaxID=53360 RepID=A0A9W6NQQ6_9ACTN|nr:hypothetical protein GCM10017581_082100 [Dactylosporangium matsuzakiense]
MPTTYAALRTATYTYVEYDDGEHEYYDRTTDPYQLTNAYDTLPAARRTTLHTDLDALQHCHTDTTCWAAGHTS